MRPILAIVALLVFSALSFSATIHVPDDYTTIQAAIDASANGDTIIVRPGTYVENIRFKGKAITLTSESGPEATIIDGNMTGSVVVFGKNEQADSVLEGFTLTNGSGTLSDFFGYSGGGIAIKDSSPTITGNIIRDNAPDPGTGKSSGGGLYIEGDSSPTVSRNSITGNICQGHLDTWGGGIYNYHGTSSSRPLITDNLIKGNRAESDYGSGGGIEIAHSNATISRNTIEDNLAFGSAGGIDCAGSDHDVKIRNNIIRGNQSQTGGGINLVDCAPLIYHNLITANTAFGNFSARGCGGGIFCGNASLPLIIDNIITDNDARNAGGGISCWTYAHPDIVNNMIAGNTAKEGGGIWCYLHIYPVITNNTITANSASEAGGGIMSIDEDNSLTVRDTILWGNSAPAGPEIYVGGEFLISYSDVAGGQASVHVEPGGTLDWGDGMIDADPLFVTGPKGAYCLSQPPCQVDMSPCVDTGDPASDMVDGATRTDEVQDTSPVDMGYHYPLVSPDREVDLKCNGQDWNVTVNAGDNVEMTIYLRPADLLGVDHDVWVLAVDPGLNKFAFGADGKWHKGWCSEYFTGPLGNMCATVYNAPLPVGSYRAWFCIDSKPNGNLNVPSIAAYDTLKFQVVP